MARPLFLLLCLFAIFNNCSTNNRLLKKHNYAKAVNESIFRLSCDADNRRAGRLLLKSYTEALDYYQNEIDQFLMSDDLFRWTKTLDVLEEINGLSEEILYNSEASRLICEPKFYTSEIADVRQKAVTELYEAGINCLALNSKEKAKEAYFYFVKAGKLDPKYKDVGRKIQEAKDRATLKVIIEPASAFTQNDVLGFSTKTFTHSLFYKLRLKFPGSSFISFYTPEEAQEQKLKNPDQIVQIEISNFEMLPRRYLARKNAIVQPSKKIEIVNGKYVWKEVEQPDFSGPGVQEHKHEYTRLEMKSSVGLNISSLSENKSVCKYRMIWSYFEELGYPNFSVINQTYLSISPDNQIFFDHFSLYLCNQVISRLTNYFSQYN